MIRHTVCAPVLLLLTFLLLPGCAGLLMVYPSECEADLPLKNYTYEKGLQRQNFEATNLWGISDSAEMLTLPDHDTFIQNSHWGLPEAIIELVPGQEQLVYSHRMWCGIGAVWIFIPAPIFLPVCKGFDRITFTEGQATHIHFRRVNATGFFVGVPVGGFIKGPNKCPPKK
jgi:hypothetical protein